MKDLLMKRLPLLFALVVFAFPAHAQTSSDADSIAIRQQAERWVKASDQQNADALAALYTEDALMLPPGAPPMAGRDRIHSLFEQQFKQFADADMNVEFETHELKVAGDWAWRRGSYVLTIDPDDGEKIRVEDKFIDIWKRGADGRWRIARDIWNHTTPPPSPSK